MRSQEGSPWMSRTPSLKERDIVETQPGRLRHLRATTMQENQLEGTSRKHNLPLLPLAAATTSVSPDRVPDAFHEEDNKPRRSNNNGLIPIPSFIRPRSSSTSLRAPIRRYTSTRSPTPEDLRRRIDPIVQVQHVSASQHRKSPVHHRINHHVAQFLGNSQPLVASIKTGCSSSEPQLTPDSGQRLLVLDPDPDDRREDQRRAMLRATLRE